MQGPLELRARVGGYVILLILFFLGFEVSLCREEERHRQRSAVGNWDRSRRWKRREKERENKAKKKKAGWKYLGLREAGEEMGGGIAQGLEAAGAIVPRAVVAGIGEVVLAELTLAAGGIVEGGAGVGAGEAGDEAALVGNLALLAVVARPFTVALSKRSGVRRGELVWRGGRRRRRKGGLQGGGVTFCFRR